MLMLTEAAADVVRQLAEAPGAAGLRISMGEHSPDTRGPTLTAELVAEPDQSDQVVEAAGARLFLAPGAEEALSDKVLDAETEQEQVRFSILEQEQQDQEG